MRDGSVYLQDADSTHGTFCTPHGSDTLLAVRSKSPQKLQDRDHISFGVDVIRDTRELGVTYI